VPPVPGRPRPRIKRLRIAVILAGVGALAMVSTVFGMMMAVAGDLQPLENREEFSKAKNSVVFDVRNNPLGTLTGNKNRILVSSIDISRNVKSAVVAIEDRRFYEHRGVDFQGIGRAVLQDVIARDVTQGASTITQQFVKNALEAQGNRTVFQKLREAALAYHLEREWPKDKVLTQYLNTIYFGEGAYGIEAAARTYFGGSNYHPGCGEDGGVRCASLLAPEEAALLAGMIASPSAYSPRENPEAAMERRNSVLEKMLEMGAISEPEFEAALTKALPAASQIEPPVENSAAPYFTSWMTQQLVDKYGAGKTFGGGLRIRTTLDLELQERVEEIAVNTLSHIEPTAAVVVIDNRTGGVRAMVGGPDFEQRPFNIATNGHRQPGSAFKPFILLTALEKGVSPSQAFSSRVKSFPVPNSPGEKFVVHNYEDEYAGSRTLTSATTFSDNSVYAELGLDIGTRNVARTAREMGIRSPVSTNPAMTLGALKEGVTPLEMAYAYTTLARGGERVSGSEPNIPNGPVAIQEVKDVEGEVEDENKVRSDRVIPQDVAEQAISILRTVVSTGTGERANTAENEWGKTGTTDDNGDAWFVGATDDITVAVWVGHATSTKSMKFDFGGEPVDGGTYPALIWHDVVVAFEQLQAARGVGDESTSSGVAAPAAVEPQAAPQDEETVEPAPAEGEGGIETPQQAPEPQAPPTPAAPPNQGGGNVGDLGLDF
jgi:penicillin-binding protein 1A